MDDQRNSYAIDPDHATVLLGFVNMATHERERIMLKFMCELKKDTIISLFAQFIGMANSVVANNREMIEILGWSTGATMPGHGPGPNLPDLTGACLGIRNAAGIKQDALCHGCAFRLGTPANQSPITGTDARVCAQPGEETFFCHDEETMDGVSPTKPCPGWVQARVMAKKESA